MRWFKFQSETFFRFYLPSFRVRLTTQKLNAVGLSLEYHGDEIVVTGSSYGHQTLLKQFKYRFDPSRKCWWKETQNKRQVA